MSSSTVALAWSVAEFSMAVLCGMPQAAFGIQPFPTGRLGAAPSSCPSCQVIRCACTSRERSKINTFSCSHIGWCMAFLDNLSDEQLYDLIMPQFVGHVCKAFGPPEP